MRYRWLEQRKDVDGSSYKRIERAPLLLQGGDRTIDDEIRVRMNGQRYVDKVTWMIFK